MNVEIIYDGKCPFCTHYALCSRLQSLGELKLTDARSFPNMKHHKGYDLNKGMLLIIDDVQYYYGADALAAIALHSSQQTFMTRLLINRRASSVIYPLLTKLRAIYLAFRGWLFGARI